MSIAICYSEVSISSQSKDCDGVLLQWLVDVVWVHGILGSLFFLRAEISLGKELLSGNDILLEHLAEVDIVDLDEMC